MTNTSTVWTGFWVVSIIGVLWNLMGVYQFFIEYGYWKNPSTRTALEPNMAALYDSTPAWLYGVFAVAVLTGLLGCIGLLMRKSWAVPLLLVSLIAVVIQFGYNLLGTELLSLLGPTSAIMPAIVMLIALGLYLFGRKSLSRGWLA